MNLSFILLLVGVLSYLLSKKNTILILICIRIFLGITLLVLISSPRYNDILTEVLMILVGLLITVFFAEKENKWDTDLLIYVLVSHFPTGHPLANMPFQRKLLKKSYLASRLKIGFFSITLRKIDDNVTANSKGYFFLCVLGYPINILPFLEFLYDSFVNTMKLFILFVVSLGGVLWTFSLDPTSCNDYIFAVGIWFLFILFAKLLLFNKHIVKPKVKLQERLLFIWNNLCIFIFIVIISLIIAFFLRYYYFHLGDINIYVDDDNYYSIFKTIFVISNTWLLLIFIRSFMISYNKTKNLKISVNYSLTTINSLNWKDFFTTIVITFLLCFFKLIYSDSIDEIIFPYVWKWSCLTYCFYNIFIEPNIVLCYLPTNDTSTSSNSPSLVTTSAASLTPIIPVTTNTSPTIVSASTTQGDARTELQGPNIENRDLLRNSTVNRDFTLQRRSSIIERDKNYPGIKREDSPTQNTSTLIEKDRSSHSHSKRNNSPILSALAARGSTPEKSLSSSGALFRGYDIFPETTPEPEPFIKGTTKTEDDPIATRLYNQRRFSEYYASGANSTRTIYSNDLYVEWLMDRVCKRSCTGPYSTQEDTIEFSSFKYKPQGWTVYKPGYTQNREMILPNQMNRNIGGNNRANIPNDCYTLEDTIDKVKKEKQWDVKESYYFKCQALQLGTLKDLFSDALEHYVVTTDAREDVRLRSIFSEPDERLIGSLYRFAYKSEIRSRGLSPLIIPVYEVPGFCDWLRSRS